MKHKILKFSSRLIPFTIVLFLIQFLIVDYLLNDIDFFYSTFVIYLFHFFATLLIYLLLVFIFFNFKDKTGFAFMGASLIKMMMAIVFLLPMLLNNRDNAFENLMTFFIPYFLYLIFETLYAVKLINSQ